MMCERSITCAFYQAHNKKPNDSKLHQMLIDTYCEGDFHEVCRRKGYEEEMGSVPIAELGPNGYNVDSNKRIY